MNTSEHLISARAHIADKEHWWNGDSYNYNGDCALTALVDTGAAFDICEEYLSEAAVSLFGTRLIAVNDDAQLGHPAVLACYDLAIKRAKIDEGLA